KPYAAQTVRAVELALDGYAKDWVTKDMEACAATRLRGEQSQEQLNLRTDCLTQRRAELKALVDVFAGDGNVLAQAVHAAQSLTPLDSCVNTAALKALVLPLTDPATRHQADELRKRIATLKALQEAGKYIDALPIAPSVSAEAKSLRYDPIEAEALLLLGSAQSKLSHHKEAEQAYRQTVLVAEAAGLDEIAAKAWMGLVWTFTNQVRFEQGHEAAEHALAVITRMGGHDRLRSELFRMLGVLLNAEGKLDEAIARVGQSLTVAERVFGPSHPSFALILGILGNFFMLREDYDEAASH